MSRIFWMVSFLLGVAVLAWLEWRDDRISDMATFLATGLWSAVCGIGYTLTQWWQEEGIASVRRLGRGRSGRKYILGVLFLATVLSPGVDGIAEAAEKLDCQFCHKYRGLSRVDEQGRFRLFYVNTELFEGGPHRRNNCVDCHVDIDRVPHNPAKPVDCSQQCHVAEPANKTAFSHKSIEDTLARSVHGRYDAQGKLKPHAEDYPQCKDCHEEPLYRPISVFKGEVKSGVSQRSISRCKSCHKSDSFAEDFYEHVSTRLRKTRFPLETIEACARCHQDPEFRKRHNLDDVVTSYKQTFHGKMIMLGSERTPDCIDCHVVEGENNHLIEAKTKSTSAVHTSNVGNTCRSSECHTKASPKLAGYQTHVTYDRKKYPLQFYMLLFFKGLMAVVMYFFLVLIFLELMRRLFPTFAFFKDNSPHHDLARKLSGKNKT